MRLEKVELRKVGVAEVGGAESLRGEGVLQLRIDVTEIADGAGDVLVE